jgi:hypothetical protein
MGSKKKINVALRTPINKNIDPEKIQPKPLETEIRFRFDSIDITEYWCLGGISTSDLHQLLPRLKHFETMKIKELFYGGTSARNLGKNYSVNTIIPAAQKRLQQLGMDDQDEIFRLRIDGEKRLYGILRGFEFSIIWWDPEHEIFPSELRNT